MKPLPQSFFARDTVVVAQDLIGKIIEIKGIKSRIVETEAYCRDEASHAHKKTERSQIMFDTYSYVYVYLIYGMYHCLNFTANKKDAGAVLIRAVEPLDNFEKLKLNRNTDKITSLCSGPGKLCQALGIDKKYNGLKLGKEIKIFDDGFTAKIGSSSRIGIVKAKELPWRFFAEGSEFVSKS